MSNYLDYTGLSYFWDKIKDKISTSISTHNSDSTAHSTVLSNYSTTTNVTNAISTHNSDTTAHADIRALISSSGSSGSTVLASKEWTTTTVANQAAYILTGDTFPSSSSSKYILIVGGIVYDPSLYTLTTTTNTLTFTTAPTEVKSVRLMCFTGSTPTNATLSDSVTTTSSTTAASSTAVKSAYDLANTANATATSAQTTANAALPKTGGTMTGTITQSNSCMLVGNGGAGNNYYIGAEPTLHAGARIRLNVAQAGTVNTGVFELVAVRDNTEAYLNGDASGTLQWNGQTIQTSSDATLKQDASAVPDADLDAWAAMDWQRFHFKADVTRKGQTARYHTGLLAQNAIAAITDAGGNPLSYGIFCKLEDEKDEEGNIIKEGKWTVRYEEALAMEAAYLRNKISKLEERIVLLENNNSNNNNVSNNDEVTN